MQVIRLKVAALTSDPRNARKHDKDSLTAIQRSLKKFGQQKPIVVNADNVVIAGNGTLAAAAALGWKTLEAVRSTLTDAEAKAFAIADNRTAEHSTWDYHVLATSLRELETAGLDPADTGWSPEEMSNFMGVVDWTPGDGGDLEGIKPSRYTAKFTAEQWAQLAQVLGTDKPEEMAARILKKVCG